MNILFEGTTTDEYINNYE